MTSPPETDRQYAYFFFSGEGDTQGLNQTMGMTADKSWNSGDRFTSFSGTELVRKSSYWRVDSGLNDTDSLEDHLAALVQRLKPKKDSIRWISGRFQPWIKCVSYSYQSFGLAIPFNVQRELTELGISLSFAVYPLGDLHEEVIALRDAAETK